MTGEMWHIDENGKDDNGNEWPIHAAIAKALCDEGHDASLQPFDQYQGPYILIGKDARLGQPPYAVATQHLGVVRLWVVSSQPDSDGILWRIYREDTDTLSSQFYYDDTEGAIACAKELMTPIKEEATYDIT